MDPRRSSAIAFLLAVSLLLVGGTGCGRRAASPARTAAPGAVAPVVNPLMKAHVGEWAIYRRPGGAETTWRIVEVNPLTKAVKVQRVDRDPKTKAIGQSSVDEFSPNYFLFSFGRAGALVASVGIEDIDVAGRTWHCLRVDQIGRFQGHTRSWFSAAVPALGLVKQVSLRPDGKVRLVNFELESWGKKK